MYRVLLLKVGTRVHVSRPGFGMVGEITGVAPDKGMYRVTGFRGWEPVRVDENRIEAYVDRRAW
jgi:hypothetical protein